MNLELNSPLKLLYLQKIKECAFGFHLPVIGFKVDTKGKNSKHFNTPLVPHLKKKENQSSLLPSECNA